MRYIRKSPPPKAFVEWRCANPDNFSYADIPDKESLRRALIKDQGGLCAYTMKRITLENSHIEHFYPQSGPDKTKAVDYANLFACYPGSGTHCSFGAIAKGDRLLPCGPGSRHVEDRFLFGADGSITGKDPEASECISILNLQDPLLVEERRSVVDGIIALHKRGILTIGKIESELRRLCAPEHGTRLPEYCVVRERFLCKYLEKLKKRSVRLKKEGHDAVV
ncbi:MAG: hypothetical protein IJ164_02260 [Duodenibacillus sp.]|nr:hypothetical protein [Duodenibacillus sp.]